MAQTIGSIDLASLKNLRDDVTQYFWFESNSSSAWGSGAHVTLYPESQFTDSTSSNYMKGQNIIMNTDGFSIRNGALPMMVLDNDSLDFNAINTTQGTYTTMATFGLTGATIGQTSGAHIQISSSGLDVNIDSSTNIASFGTNGARIGKNAAAHSVIDADGQRFYASNGTTQLANIGYASGAAQSGTATAPYYDFGIRKSNTTKGNYSVAEGNNVTASGFVSHAEGDGTTASEDCSHAEGSDTTASGPYSHAEGWVTTASKSASHAEGDGTTASGYYSHAEGVNTTASGNNSHAQNNGTIAGYVSQTAIGEYNKNKSTNAFEIGNGSSSARSNAFEVDWNGNITIKNHSSYIGTMQSYTSAEISCATGKYYQLAYLTLDDGVWMIDYVGYFPSTNTTGIRDTFVTTATSNYNNVTTAPASYGNITRDRRKGENHAIYCKSHFPVNIESTTTFRLIGYQTSGQTNSLTGRMYAVRIN